MSWPRLGNALLCLACQGAARRYRQARREPRRRQLRILRGYLGRHAASEFGRRHRYGAITSLAQFRDAVPIRTYEDFEPWIERIRRGRPAVLTSEPVLAMEKTSGSSGPAKYIPYTASLRREFQNAIGAWLADLYRHRPALFGGPHYWSVSPVARRKEVTPGGLPVGFADDTEYLGGLQQRMMGRVIAVPGSVARLPDIEDSRRATLRYLMRCRDLRLISVWNPSFLSLLMNHLPAGATPSELWPRMALISCWTSAAAARFVGELEALFPGVEIQGKGLLLTEGVVSFPEIGRPAPSAALTSHFLEFVAEDGRCHLVDELQIGWRYRVVITTGGGLARYDTQDLVDVVAPAAFDFVGRGNCVSDLVGEKLSEPFVARTLEAAARRHGLSGFLMLAPEWGRPPAYALFIEALGTQRAADLERSVDEDLRASVHYDYCRRLGQLAGIRVVPVRDAPAKYLDACMARGQSAGNIKPVYLRRELDWRQRFGRRP